MSKKKKRGRKKKKQEKRKLKRNFAIGFRKYQETFRNLFS